MSSCGPFERVFEPATSCACVSKCKQYPDWSPCTYEYVIMCVRGIDQSGRRICARISRIKAVMNATLAVGLVCGLPVVCGQWFSGALALDWDTGCWTGLKLTASNWHRSSKIQVCLIRILYYILVSILGIGYVFIINKSKKLCCHILSFLSVIQ